MAASFATPTFVTIIQEAALEVIAMVDEADIGNVRRGEKVVFTTETFPDHEFQGSDPNRSRGHHHFGGRQL